MKKLCKLQSSLASQPTPDTSTSWSADLILSPSDSGTFLIRGVVLSLAAWHFCHIRVSIFLSKVTSLVFNNIYKIKKYVYYFFLIFISSWRVCPMQFDRIPLLLPPLRSVIFNHPTLCASHPHQVQFVPPVCSWMCSLHWGVVNPQGQHSKRTTTLLSKQLATANIPSVLGRDGTLWPPLHAGMKKDT